MRVAEASKLLVFLAALDRRNSDDETAVAWAAVLHDVPLDFAQQAVIEHFRGPRRKEYFSVTHIMDAVEAQRVRIVAERRRELEQESGGLTLEQIEERDR